MEARAIDPRPRGKIGRFRALLHRYPALIALVIPVGAIAGLLLFWEAFGHRFYGMPSGSMEPGLLGPKTGSGTGDHIQIDFLIAPILKPHRGEIWMFMAPPEAGGSGSSLFVKRVLGVPGETIAIAPPRILIDGKQAVALTKTGAFNNGNSVPGIDGGTQQPPTVKDGGRVVEIASYGEQPIRIVASPDLALGSTDRQIKMRGEVLLDGGGSSVVEVKDLQAIGATDGVKGRAFRTGDTGDESPQLVVLQGRKLEYQPGAVLVNGQPISDYTPRTPEYSMAPVKLGPDEYFMMGDNRNNSNDSHAWGPLKRNRLIGRADFRTWPPGRMGLL
jgi:type IV secretory pathway protease TraF